MYKYLVIGIISGCMSSQEVSADNKVEAAKNADIDIVADVKKM